VEHFLPLYERVSRWKDRRVRLELPLFPGYIFVRIALRDQLKVLQIPGIVRLVGFNGRPAALSETEMTTLQTGLSGVKAEPYPFLKEGQIVRIRSGPLGGLSGYLVRRKQKERIVISIDSIMRAFIAEVSLDDIEIPEGR
jgi:transcription antitermination factor NusG